MTENLVELQQYIDSWISYLLNTKSLSINTVESYMSDIKLLIRFLYKYKSEHVSIEHIKNLAKWDIRAWFLHRKEIGDSSKTISRGLSALKSFVKYLIEINLMTRSSILGIRPPKIKKSLPRPLSINQINDILNIVRNIKQTDWIIKRDIAILLLIYSVGLRITEALNLNKSDIIYSQNFVNIIGKGGKERQIPIIDPVKMIIMDYLASCKFTDATALFVNKFGNRISSAAIQKLVKKARMLLGLSDSVTTHALRHSCATHLMENSGDLRGIQELLGHSSISTTQIYADIAQKYIEAIYDQCHPLSKLKAKQ